MLRDRVHLQARSRSTPRPTLRAERSARPLPRPRFDPDCMSGFLSSSLLCYMRAVMNIVASRFTQYLSQPDYRPLFYCGDSISILKDLPSEQIDFCMTSPPYWGQRQYSSGG